MSQEDCPFIVGAKVALVDRRRWDNSIAFQEVEIAMVYKNGNFVLASNPKQL